MGFGVGPCGGSSDVTACRCGGGGYDGPVPADAAVVGCCRGHLAVVQMLLEEDVDVECRDDYGRDPLSWAVEDTCKLYGS